MRKEKFKIPSIFISGFCLLGFISFYSCGFDSGLQMERPLPIGQFNGKTVGTWSAQYRNPKIAIVWESLTGGISIWNIGSATLDSSQAGHISFRGNFSHLPTSAVVNPDSEYVIGKLWLYDDANGDGQLNLTYPPDYVTAQNSILAAKQDFQSALNQFYATADSSPSRVDKLDTFLITNGPSGLVYFASSPNNPIPNQDGSNPAWSPSALLHARDRVQYAPNNWETFFQSGR